MKVFIVLDDRENGADAVCGVYSTKELAVAAKERFASDPRDHIDDYAIEECEVKE